MVKIVFINSKPDSNFLTNEFLDQIKEQNINIDLDSWSDLGELNIDEDHFLKILTNTNLSPEIRKSVYEGASSKPVLKEYENFLNNQKFLEFCDITPDEYNIQNIKLAIDQLLSREVTPETIDEQATKLKDDLTDLKIGEFLCLASGGQNVGYEHFCVIKFTKEDTDSFNLKIFNAQKNMEYFQGGIHSDVKNSCFPYLSFSGVTAEELFKFDLLRLKNVLSTNCPNLSSLPAECQGVNMLLSYLMPIPNKPDQTASRQKAFKYLLSDQRSGNCTVKSLTASVLHFVDDKLKCRKLVIANRLYLSLKAYNFLKNDFYNLSIEKQQLAKNILNYSCKSLSRMLSRHKGKYSEQKFLELSATLIQLKKGLSALQLPSVKFEKKSDFAISTENYNKSCENIDKALKKSLPFVLSPAEELKLKGQGVAEVNEAITAKIVSFIETKHSLAAKPNLSHYSLSNNCDITWDNLTDRLKYLIDFIQSDHTRCNKTVIVDNFVCHANYLINEPVSKNLSHAQIISALEQIKIISKSSFQTSLTSTTFQAELMLIAYQLTLRADDLREKSADPGILKQFKLNTIPNIFNSDNSFNLYTSKESLKRSLAIITKLNQITTENFVGTSLFQEYMYPRDRDVVESSEFRYFNKVLPKVFKDCKKKLIIDHMKLVLCGQFNDLFSEVGNKYCLEADEVKNEFAHIIIFRNIFLNLTFPTTEYLEDTYLENYSILHNEIFQKPLIKEINLSRKRADQLVTNLISEIINDPEILLQGDAPSDLLLVLYQSLDHPWNKIQKTTPLIFAVENDPYILKRCESLSKAIDLLEKKLTYGLESKQNIIDACALILHLQCAILSHYQQHCPDTSSIITENHLLTHLITLENRLVKFEVTNNLSNNLSLLNIKANIWLLQFQLNNDFKLLAQAFLALAKQPKTKSRQNSPGTHLGLISHHETWQTYLQILSQTEKQELQQLSTQIIELLNYSSNELNFKIVDKKVIAQDAVNKWKIDFCHAFLKLNQASFFSEKEYLSTQLFRFLSESTTFKVIEEGKILLHQDTNLGEIKLYVNTNNAVCFLEKEIEGKRYAYIDPINLRFLPCYLRNNFTPWRALSSNKNQIWLQHNQSGEFGYKITDANEIISLTENQTLLPDWYDPKQFQFHKIILSLASISSTTFCFDKQKQTIVFQTLISPESGAKLKLNYLSEKDIWVLADNQNLKVDFEGISSWVERYLCLKSLDEQQRYILLPKSGVPSSCPFENLASNPFATRLMKIEIVNGQFKAKSADDKVELFFLLLALKKYSEALLQIKSIPFNKKYKRELRDSFFYYLRNIEELKDPSPSVIATLLEAKKHISQVTGLPIKTDMLNDYLGSNKLTQNSVPAKLKSGSESNNQPRENVNLYINSISWNYKQIKPTRHLKYALSELRYYDQKDTEKFLDKLPSSFQKDFQILKTEELNSAKILDITYLLLYDKSQNHFPDYNEDHKSLLLSILRFRACENSELIPSFKHPIDYNAWRRYLSAVTQLEESGELNQIYLDISFNESTSYLSSQELVEDKVTEVCDDIIIADPKADCTDILFNQSVEIIQPDLPKNYPPHYTKATKHTFEMYQKDQIFAASKPIISHRLKSNKTEAIKSLDSQIEILSKNLEEASQVILRTINQKPTASDAAFHLLQLQGQAIAKLKLTDVLKACAAKNFFTYIKKLNPSLNRDEINSLKKTVLCYLRDYTQRESLIRGASALKSTSDTKVQEGINTLAQERAFQINDENLFLLYFEYKSGLRLREKQVDLIQTCLSNINKGQFGLVFQLIMAGGKTSVILSTLVEILCEMDWLVCVLSHHSQLASLSSSFATFQMERFNKHLVLIDATAKELSTVEGLKIVWDRICYAKKNRLPLLMKSTFPQLLLGLFQKHSLNFIEKNIGQEVCKGLAQILHKLQTEGISFIDECDSSLSINTEVHLPVNGSKQMKGDESKLVAAIYTFLLENDLAKILENNQPEAVESYETKILPVIAAKMAHKLCRDYSNLAQFGQELQRLFSSQISSADEALALSQEPLTSDSSSDAKLLRELYSLQNSNDASCIRAFEMIALCKHILTNILPTALGKSYNRHYGPLLDDEKGETVPYQGVGSPSHTKFGDPYLALALSLQASLYGKIGPKEINFLAKELYEAAKSFSTHEHKPLDEMAEFRLFKGLTNLDLQQFIQNKELIHQATEFINDEKYPARRLKFRMETAPYSVKYYPDEVCITPCQLSQQFKDSVAFSGTIYNVDSFARYETILKDEGTEGSILNKLQNATLKTTKDQSLAAILANITDDKHCHRVHAIIDSGGFLKDLPNLELAKDILKTLTHIEGVLFLHTSGEFCILTDQKIIALENCSLAEITKHIALDKLFVLFDELRSTGTDIPLTNDAICYQTVDPKMPLRTLLQGALRARKFFENQEIVLNIAKNCPLEIANTRDLIYILQANEAVSAANQTLKSLKNQQQINANLKFINKAILQFLNEKVDVNFLAANKQKLYSSHNFANYREWIKVTDYRIDTEQWLPKNLSTNLLMHLPDSFKAVDNTSNIEIDLTQETEVETETQVENELQQEIETEFTNNQTAISQPAKELTWPDKLNFRFIYDLSTSIHDVLKNHHRGSVNKKFIDCFPADLRLTKNLITVSTESHLSIFDKMFKHSHSLLHILSEGSWHSILLSKHDATDLKPKLDKPKADSIFMTDLFGNLTAGNVRSNHWLNLSQSSQLKKTLWYANFFNGNLGYLLESLDLSVELFSKNPDLYLKYLLLKNGYKKHLFSKIISSELAINCHKILENGNKITCSYRAEEIARSTRSLKLTPIKELKNVPADRVNELTEFQVPHLETKVQIRSLSSDKIKFISAKGINHLKKSQVSYVKDCYLRDLTAIKLINALPVDKLKLLSPEQLSQIEDMDKLLQAPVDGLINLLYYTNHERLLNHIRELENLDKLDNKLIPYLTNEQLSSQSKEFLNQRVSFMSKVQLNYLIKNNLLSAATIIANVNNFEFYQLKSLLKEKITSAFRKVKKLKLWQISFLSSRAVNKLELKKLKPAKEEVSEDKLPIDPLKKHTLNQLGTDYVNDETFAKLKLEAKKEMIKQFQKSGTLENVSCWYEWLNHVSTKQFNLASTNKKRELIENFKSQPLSTLTSIKKWQIPHLTKNHLKELIDSESSELSKILPKLNYYQLKNLINDLKDEYLRILTSDQVQKLIPIMNSSQVEQLKISSLDKEFIKTCNPKVQKKLSWPQFKHVYTANSFFNRLAQKIGAAFKLGFNLCLLPFELAINAAYIILATPLAIFSKTWRNKWKERFSHSKKASLKRALPAVAIFSYSKYKWFEIHNFSRKTKE